MPIYLVNLRFYTGDFFMRFDDNENKKRRPEGRRLNSVEPFVYCCGRWK